MLIRHCVALTFFALSASGPLLAETPMSAIDWLSDSIAEPRLIPPSMSGGDISENALPQDVSVSSLEGMTADAVGLIPARITGLPADLWRGSSSGDIAQRLRADRLDVLPAIQDLFYLLLLAELDPPADAGPEATVFLARVDSLLALGALDQARALIDIAGISDPEVFRRAFDISLLLHDEDAQCARLRAAPSLSLSFPARIFCLARGGDWDAAALTLETARALGFLEDGQNDLLARFLEPSLSDGADDLPPATHPSPLTFRIFEAIGEPLPTSQLPRAFAHADLHSNSGWKAQLEAAERLVRTGAMDANHLLGLYSAQKPAASGGVWERARAVQEFETALAGSDERDLSDSLIQLWQQLSLVELEVPFARLFAGGLAQANLSGDAATLAQHMVLLSGDDRLISQLTSDDPETRFLIAIAQGNDNIPDTSDPMRAAIRDGFSRLGMPVRLRSLTEGGRLGEAILRAVDLFGRGSHGDWDELTDALIFFRSIGLRTTARDAALQLMILDRRG